LPDDNDDLTTESEQDSDLVRKLRKELRAKSKAPEVDVDAIKRENAFLKAGINPDDPKVKYFAKAYDGPLETAAILAEAKAAGFISEQPPAQASGGEDDERDLAMGGIDTMRSAAQAQRSQTAPGNDPFGAEYQAAMLQLREQPMTSEAGVQAALRIMQKFGVKTTQDM
jgi:hypothetical protein